MLVLDVLNRSLNLMTRESSFFKFNEIHNILLTKVELNNLEPVQSVGPTKSSMQFKVEFELLIYCARGRKLKFISLCKSSKKYSGPRYQYIP